MAKRFLIRFHRQNGIDTPAMTIQVCRHFGMCRNIGKIVDLMIELNVSGEIQSNARPSRYGVASLSPMIPARIHKMLPIRITSRDSPNKIMPATAVPAAPIPVQMA